jgi:hypothetical protein
MTSPKMLLLLLLGLVASTQALRPRTFGKGIPNHEFTAGLL